MKRSDVTGKPFEWLLGEKNGYIRPPHPYFIVLISSVKTLEVKAFAEVSQNILQRQINASYTSRTTAVTTYFPSNQLLLNRLEQSFMRSQIKETV